MYADPHRAQPSLLGDRRFGKEEQPQQQLEKLVDAGLLRPRLRPKDRQRNVEFKAGVEAYSTRHLILAACGSLAVHWRDL